MTDERGNGEPAARGGLPVAFGSGAVIGVAAGLIGVGGGEFRIPLLLYLFRGNVRVAASVNLLVGLFTVTLSFFRRLGQSRPSGDALLLAGVMAVVSVVGAILGARYAHRIKTPLMFRFVIGYLLVVGVWMVIESILAMERPGLAIGGPFRLILAAAVGLGIAAVSASLGVAGGEMRIPALIYLFGYGIKEAGTLSLLASIPTVAAGAASWHRLGHLPRSALRVAITMGLGSLLGVWAGTALLPSMDKHLLTGILGVILLVATALLLRSRSRGEEPLGR